MGEGGSIILTGSSAGTTGAPAFGTYSASKAAVRNLARTWAADLKGTGIRINVLSPGPTATELAKAAVGEEGIKAFASMNPLQRMADPAEIGAAARSEEHTSELQSLMRISYAVFCLKKNKDTEEHTS